MDVVQVLKVGPLKDYEMASEKINNSFSTIPIHFGWNNKGVELAGSSLVSFRKNGSISGTSEIFRVSFHTAFIGPSNILECNIATICPESISKDNMFNHDTFKVTFEFEDACDKCFSHCTEIKDICGKCRQNQDLAEEMSNWE